MKIGILQVGRVADPLVARYGEYPPMFEDMFAEAAPDFTYAYYETVAGVLPAHPQEADGWVITGSKWGVYDDVPWIEPLKDFIRAARAADVPMLGVCFGHQVMAEALGGRAVKSDKGWAFGRHDYTLHHTPSWMEGAAETVGLFANHQDQVTAIPEDATLIASNDHCSHAIVVYGEPEAPWGFTIQPHPEFDRSYAGDLIRYLLDQGRAPADVALPALETIPGGQESDLAARWSAAFLRLAARRAKAA
ncbi:MAG: gamma-glutamyl-gamma-aminobutyrate hydrolase family protein [Pseudomonadota bacterium]